MLPFTLHQLRILKAIATEKNFTKAAAVLYLSQPSLSKQIKILERNLNTLLINRERNKISLTESGEVLLQYSNRILALCEESCRAVIDLKNGDRGNLRVGASQTIGTYLLPRILALFAQNYPQIDLNVQVNSTRIVAKKIINREIDIAVVGGEISDDLKKYLTIEPFVYDELRLVISKSHPFARKTKIQKEDLYCLDFITLNSNSTIKKFIDKILIQNQIDTKQLKTILQLNSIEGIKTAVNLGLGAAFLSSSAIEKEIKLKTLDVIKIENIEIKRKLSIISNPKCYKAKAFKFFYNELYHLKARIED
uniref:Probable RuBisCO transcriptional regulator n=1 Tax=Cylindrotheca closterium TaxID=2856 RepID=A0A023HAI9_9STRA|nr:rubisco operon transcription regulator [Cylindrotheca closterium]AGH28675.1 rubisco operon transcription regulator [Cylindrotheca closterium]